MLLNDNSESIKYLCGKDKRFKRVYEMIGPISYQIHDDIYEFIIGEIIEQMLSVKAAAVIYSRLESLCEGKVTPVVINKLSNKAIRDIGTSERKVNTIKEFTRCIVLNELDLDSLHIKSDQEIIDELTEIKGIGIWTAKMVLIFSLDRQDVLPFEDVAFLQGYRWAYNQTDCSEKAIRTKCKKWKPYSSIAARYLYRALDLGFTKEPFHFHKTT